MKKILIPVLLTVFIISSAQAQWNNRYPKVDGYGHHVYLEAFELPVYNAGPTDPVPSPDGKSIAFSAKGWLWVMDENGKAVRVTYAGEMDARPSWSNDGKSIVFVRDNSLDTHIMLLDLESRLSRELVNTPAMDLDPVFSPDDKFVYYSSADSGSFDIWRLELATGEKERVTELRSLERLPVLSSQGEFMLYLKKYGFSYDSFEKMDLESGETSTVLSDNFISMASISLGPDNRTLAYTIPHEDDYEIRLLDLNVPGHEMIISRAEGLPLNPKFSADGQWIYFNEPDKNERHQIKRVSVYGGETETIEVKEWDFGEDLEQISFSVNVNGENATARINITDAQGHSFFPELGTLHSDGQSGRIFFYADGNFELSLPQGNYTVRATQGFSTYQFEQPLNVDGSLGGSYAIELEQIWDSEATGWYAADNHFHLNYGGTYHLDPEDIKIEMLGEGVAVGYPLVANLHNRFLEQDLFGWKTDSKPFIHFGQEVRSHFLGHLNVLGNEDLFWPWVWGPYYDLYGREDITNASALQFTSAQGGVGGYVHPVSERDPLSERGKRGIPTELVADFVTGDADILEVGCLWTDEIGTAELWHRFLNIGETVALSAGSDVMNDYFRTMAIGAARVYVKPDGALSLDSFLKALKEGKSFVSTGPMIEFNVEGKEAGEILDATEKAKFSLTVHSAVPYDLVEIFVNGEVVYSKKGSPLPGSLEFKGSLKLPAGGWITARVSGEDAIWPVMDSYPFAESGAIWIGEIGSTDPAAKKKAAGELLEILEVSEKDLKKGYGDNPIPKLEAQFAKARKMLEEMAGE